MSLEFIGFSLSFVGKLLIAYTAIMVHYRVHREHKITESVFKAMRKEYFFGIIGVVLLIVGFILEAPFRL